MGFFERIAGRAQAHEEIARLREELDKRDRGIARLKRRRGELQEQVEELTRERDSLKNALANYQNEEC